VETARRDARLEGEEQVDASDSDSVAAALGGAARELRRLPPQPGGHARLPGRRRALRRPRRPLPRHPRAARARRGLPRGGADGHPRARLRAGQVEPPVSNRSRAKRNTTFRSRSGALGASTRSTRSWRPCPASSRRSREASFRLCLTPGLLKKLLALPEGEEPEPYAQSADAVAVHVVELRNGKTVVGMTVTRGGSARSTAEPAAPRRGRDRSPSPRRSGRKTARDGNPRPRGLPGAPRHTSAFLRALTGPRRRRVSYSERCEPSLSSVRSLSPRAAAAETTTSMAQAA
jgi:hypothetical protein